MQPEKSAADQVKEAVWVYTQRVVVVLLFFGAGLFLGYQLWGAGEMGQPALAARTEKLELDLNKLRNDREECQKVLEVTRTRKDTVEKELAALKASAQQ